MTRKIIDLNKIKVDVPSDEEILARHQQSYIAAASNPTCFANWFPAVEQLGVRTPKSDWIPVTADMQLEIMSEDESRMMKAMKPVADKVRQFGEIHGYPLFIKNSLFSAKHSWKHSCYIDNADVNIERHIALIFYEWMCVGMGAGMARHLVVRQFIDTNPVFHAFADMPVTQEFRLFADKGRVYGYQPYWPEMSIVDPSVPDWRERLKAISTPSEDLLAEMREMASAITSSLGGNYSVDFLIDRDGKPWLIDMAEARTSFMCDTGFTELAGEFV